MTRFARSCLRRSPRSTKSSDATLNQSGPSRFTLRLDNVSGGSATPTPFAPGVFVVHNNPAPLFANGQPDYNLGLEAIAEDGNPGALAGYLGAHSGINTPLAPVAWKVHQPGDALFAGGVRASAGLESLAEDGSPVALVGEQGGSNAGAAAVGRGASAPAPIFAPDGNYTFTITAEAGDHLSLASMFVQSNDWFYGLDTQPLFDEQGDPRSGDVTASINLYDAGTEIDEAPGYGSNQAPRQPGPNSGPSENGIVTPIGGPGGHIHVTITPVN